MPTTTGPTPGTARTPETAATEAVTTAGRTTTGRGTTPGTAGTPETTVTVVVVETVAAAAPQTSTPLVRTNIPATMLGGKAKVILEPPKKTAAKLVASKSKTRKSRKIRVSLSGLGKRITRHKKIQKDARVSSIEEIKKTLVAAKLIKPESKAPETMLRQIYADYQTLKNKAL